MPSRQTIAKLLTSNMLDFNHEKKSLGTTNIIFQVQLTLLANCSLRNSEYSHEKMLAFLRPLPKIHNSLFGRFALI